MTKKTTKKTTTKKVKRKDIQKEDSLKELEVIDKTNYRQFMILLYENTKSYDYEEVINKLTSYKKWAYIKHVPEVEEKKEHVHAIIILENKTSISSISKKLGVPKQFIQSIQDLRQSVRYLIHLGWDDKIQYDLEISVGAGLPNNKAYRYTIVRDMYKDKAISKLEYRNYMIKQLGMDIQEYPESLAEQQEIGVIDEETQQELQQTQQNANIEGLTASGNPSLNYARNMGGV